MCISWTAFLLRDKSLSGSLWKSKMFEFCFASGLWFYIGILRRPPFFALLGYCHTVRQEWHVSVLKMLVSVLKYVGCCDKTVKR